eukprot:7628919-Pyramimonas_sp.AAC.1
MFSHFALMVWSVFRGGVVQDRFAMVRVWFWASGRAGLRSGPARNRQGRTEAAARGARVPP